MKKLLSVLILLVSTAFAAESSSLERAYAKEFAFLKAQKNMLQKRLDEVRSSNAKKMASAKAEVESLENIVLKKNLLSQKRSNELAHAEENAQNLSDDTSLIESVLSQAKSNLDSYGVNFEVDEKDYKSSLKKAFSKTNSLIYSLSSIKVEDGKFYLNDGTQQLGKLIKVGNIATYGVGKKVAGALVPAGDGKLKLYKAPQAAQTAKALASSSKLDKLDIFLYENKTTEIDDLSEKTAYSVINSGGVIGWVIIILGVAGLFIALLRFIFLSGAKSSNTQIAKVTIATLHAGGVDKALAYLKTKAGSTARVLKATVRNLDSDREHVEDIVAEQIMHESQRLDRYGSTLMVIAAVSPLLGLLGTVTGMIATFDIITEFGTGDPKLLSGGISIALVTTELGLIVAIPILMIGNLLNGWSERVKDSMEHSALHLINEYNKSK